jgi:hypothetical protein
MKLRLQLLIIIFASINAWGQTLVVNTRTSTTYVQLQEALDDAATRDGDVLTMETGFYDESVLFQKSVSLATSPDVYVRTLNFSNNCTVTLTGTLTVTDSLRFTNGYLRIPNAADMLALGDAATVTRISGHVQGVLQKNVVTTGPYTIMKFEVGDQANYTPVELSLYNVSNPGSFQVSSIPGDNPNLSLSGINPLQSVNRRYKLVNNGVTFDNCTAKLTFAAADLDTGVDYHMFRVGSFDGTSWSQPVVSLGTATDITVSGMSWFQNDELSVGEQTAPTLLYPANNSTGLFPSSRLRWNSAIGAAGYEIQLYRDTTKSPLQDLANITPAYYDIVYPSVKLGYDTTYFWRVRALCGAIASDWSPIWSFRVGTPDSVVDNPIVHLHLRHTEGYIDSLRYKPGSNRELLSQTLNASQKGGLLRVNGETGTRCTAWIIDQTPGVDTASFEYMNLSYGSKRVWMHWSASDGFEMKVFYNFSAPSKFTPGVYWLPGGDVGPLYDYVTFIDTTGKRVTRYSGYPSKDSVLFNAPARGSGITDTRFDETFGFRNVLKDSLYAATGAALNGPYCRGTYRDALVQEFAIKSTSAYWSWVDDLVEPFFNITPSGGTVTWFTGTPQNVVWQSNPSFGAGALVNIKLSTDGGLTFPVTLASAVQNSGTYTIPTVPTLSSSNCRIKVELASNPVYSGISAANFIIRSSNAVVFTIPASVVSAPGESIVLPLFVNPNGQSIYAFDARITFNKSTIALGRYRLGANLPNGWKINVNDSSARGFVQIGGECRIDSLNFPIRNADTTLVFTFNVKTVARVGGSDTLKIDNAQLSAAGSMAETFSVSGNDCPVSYQAAMSGRVTYFSNKLVLPGDSVILSYKPVGGGTGLTIDTVAITDSLGHFDFSPIPPGASASLSVRRWSSNLTSATDSSVITSGDALLAFMARDGGPTAATGFQKIAIDVNRDGRANSTDAFAILKRATGSLSNFRSLAADGNGTDWVFVDSAYVMTSANWPAAAKMRSSNPLDSARLKENFYGILLGDVQPTYGAKATGKLSKDLAANSADDAANAFGSGAVEFSVPRSMSVNVGDTVDIPVVINANKNPLGSFDVTLKYNNALLQYAGRYVRGLNLSGFQGWDMDVHADNAAGRISIGAVDFEQKMTPVTGSGQVALLKFVVMGSNKWTDSSEIVLTNVNATDTVAVALAVAANNGRVVTTGRAGVPSTFALMQNFPNPFNPSTHITFAIPEDARAAVTIYNILGQTVRSFEQADLQAGYHEIVWDGRNNGSEPVSSGVYFYRLTAVSAHGAKFSDVKRMMLLK